MSSAQPGDGGTPPSSSLSGAAFLAAINHQLRSQSWARQRLQRHSGKTLAFSLAPLALRLSPTSEGYLAAATEETLPDASLSIPPSLILRQWASGSADSAQLKTAGDTAFALDLANVLNTLSWDVEEDLSQVFGDIAAHRLAGIGRGLFGWARHAARSLGLNVSEYLTEEQPQIASSGDVRRFTREVDEARDAVERLDKRIQRLKDRQAEGKA